jgi:hypothetical protein
VSILQIVTVPEKAKTRAGHNPRTDTTRANCQHNPPKPTRCTAKTRAN